MVPVVKNANKKPSACARVPRALVREAYHTHLGRLANTGYKKIQLSLYRGNTCLDQERRVTACVPRSFVVVSCACARYHRKAAIKCRSCCRRLLIPHSPDADSSHGRGRGRASRGSAWKACARDDKWRLHSGVQKRGPKQRANSVLAEHNVIEMPSRLRQPGHHNNFKTELCVRQ